MYPQSAEEKGVPRLLLWGLLIYEALRLAVFIRIMAGGTGDGEFPSLIFGAPQALFPLMALFMAADFNRHTAYAPLYTAGKVLSILVLAGSGFFWRERIVQTILQRGLEPLYMSGGLMIIALGDILSVFCGVFLILRRNKAAGDPADGGL
jgi:hypothetical protein